MTEFPPGKDDRESVLSPFLVDQVNTRDKRLFGRFLWLTGGRLVVATLLLGGTLAITIHQDPEVQGFTSRFLLALIVATYLVSLASALALRRLRSTRLYAATQLLWDLALTTCLIYLTGGFSSGFPFLYGLQILMAAIVIGPNSSRATGVLSLTIYALTGVALSQGWLPHPPDQPAARYLTIDTEIMVIAVLHVVGLAAVTLLASGLASRLGRAGGELQRATSDAARLAHLNENIVRSLSSGLMTVDEHAVIRTINPAGASILNSTAEATVGNSVHNYIPTLQHEALGSDNRLLRAEGTARKIDGTLVPIGYSRTPLRDAAGQEHGELILFQDLSELKKLREAARRAESLAALGRLSAGLAHEIRNPLGSISGSVELIRASEALSVEEQKLLDIVLKETERLNALVTTMLELGAPRKPRFEPTDLCKLAEDVTEMARKGAAQSSTVTIATQVPLETVTANADSDQVRQVLWNLIKNAQQASPPNATITVRVWAGEAHKAYIEVADEGPGISTEDKERLYDMFYTGRKHGVGLGLALVRQIVEAHQGSIEVHSQIGIGARFVVSFPQTSNTH
jgi:two-component system sensor histidine kinase PilS (NtrC family)